MYHIFFIHSSVDGHLGCFCVLAMVSSAAVKIGVHVSFQMSVFSGYILRSGITRSCGNSVFNPLRNYPILFYFFCFSPSLGLAEWSEGTLYLLLISFVLTLHRFSPGKPLAHLILSWYLLLIRPTLVHPG